MTDGSDGVIENVADQAAIRRTPRWASQPFKDLVVQSERLDQLLHLSINGISVLQEMPRIVEAIADIEDTKEESPTQQRIEQAHRQADLARREVKEGFPLLHANHALALWSCLEAAVRLFVVRWLQNQKGALEVDAIHKLRVRIGEYESLKGDDRLFYILDRLEQESSAPVRCGITRFEKILEPFGLSGPVDEDVQRNLFELNQVRNCLMHRGGKADHRLIEACPWLTLTSGQPVIIDHHATTRYVNSVMSYATGLIARIGEYFGVDMSKHRQRKAPNESA
jgi:hypothetical protein